ncbi:MAG TPA: VWA domain-containing protein [Terriglobia bacterium]|nr:VWA domain-containing protein [Terriglobia bacterium]
MAFDHKRGIYSRAPWITAFLAGAVFCVALGGPGLKSSALAAGFGLSAQSGQDGAGAVTAQQRPPEVASTLGAPATALPAGSSAIASPQGPSTPAGSKGSAASTANPIQPPGAPAAADNQPPASVNVRQPNIHTRPIQVNVNMVMVGVTVTDPYDRIVTGLDKSNFEVFDEKVPQDIQTFSTEDVPISVGMIFDASGSMSDKIEKSKEAALQFFKTSNPEDEFMLIQFNERPDLISAFTSKFETLQDRLLFVKSGGRTALLDAIYLALNEMKKARSTRKALLVISDGGDNHSRYTENEIKRAVRESDTQIFAVAVLEPLASRNRTPEEAAGPSLLSDLASVSGGRMFSVEDASELPDIAEKISIELRNEYVIGYKPSNLVRDGRWRRIKVKLDAPRGLPPLQVYARTGYYAPTQ